MNQALRQSLIHAGALVPAAEQALTPAAANGPVLALQVGERALFEERARAARELDRVDPAGAGARAFAAIKELENQLPEPQ